MIELKTDTTKDKDKKDAKTVTLFAIDGKEYTIPAKSRPTVLLKQMWNIKLHGEEVAAATMVIDLLTPENFEALMGYEDLTDEQFNQVVELAKTVTLGDLEKTVKN